MLNNVLITGGAGFIGSTLADTLLKENCKVICVDNFCDYYSPELKRKNISNALLNSSYKLYQADIQNLDELEKIFSENKIDIIVHLAARAGVRPSIEKPVEYMQTNVMGTVNILELMKKYGVKKMCMASSSSVYGNCKAEKFSEDLNVRRPISPYAASKSACEQICYTYHHLYDLNIVMLRYFTVFGPRQRPDLAINKFVNLIRNNQPINMYGDGTSIRDYTYIDDIVSGTISAMKYDKTGYEIFNLGGGNPVSLVDMISTIETILGKKAIINKMPMQPGDVDRTVCDISKSMKLLNYKPETSFYDGVKNFINWSK